MWATTRVTRRHGSAWSTAVVLCVGLLCMARSAQAISIVDPDTPVVVIQNRLYQMAHEITLETGFLPLDAYYKGVVGTLRYTWHFNDFNAWEVFGVSYSYNWNSRLKDALLDEFGASTDDYEFREAVLIFDSNYVIKPFYGKTSFFNRVVMRTELQLNFGPAFMVYTPSSTLFSAFSYRPGANYGASARLFVSEWFSLRVDLRHYIVVALDALMANKKDAPFEIDNVLYLGLGMSFNFGYD